MKLNQGNVKILGLLIGGLGALGIVLLLLLLAAVTR
jgi:hypothetical protein